MRQYRACSHSSCRIRNTYHSSSSRRQQLSQQSILYLTLHRRRTLLCLKHSDARIKTKEDQIRILASSFTSLCFPIRAHLSYRDFLFRNLCAVSVVLFLCDLSLLQLLCQPLLVLSIVVPCSVHAASTKVQRTAKQHSNK